MKFWVTWQLSFIKEFGMSSKRELAIVSRFQLFFNSYLYRPKRGLGQLKPPYSMQIGKFRLAI